MRTRNFCLLFKSAKSSQPARVPPFFIHDRNSISQKWRKRGIDCIECTPDQGSPLSFLLLLLQKVGAGEKWGGTQIGFAWAIRSIRRLLEGRGPVDPGATTRRFPPFAAKKRERKGPRKKEEERAIACQGHFRRIHVSNMHGKVGWAERVWQFVRRRRRRRRDCF